MNYSISDKIFLKPLSLDIWIIENIKIQNPKIKIKMYNIFKKVSSQKSIYNKFIYFLINLYYKYNKNINFITF